MMMVSQREHKWTNGHSILTTAYSEAIVFFFVISSNIYVIRLIALIMCIYNDDTQILRAMARIEAVLFVLL